MYMMITNQTYQRDKEKEEKERERSWSPRKRQRRHHDHKADKSSRRSSGKFDMYNEFIPLCFN